MTDENSTTQNINQSSSTSTSSTTLPPAVIKLNTVFDKTLEKIVQSFTFEQFVESFPTIYQQHPKGKEILHQLYSTLILKFIENTRQEYEVICDERKVVEKLTQLEEVILVQQVNDTTSDAKKLKVAVDPEATVHINNLRIKNEKKQQLQEMVADMKKQNAKLKEDLADAHNETIQFENTLKRLAEQMKKAFESSSEWQSSEVKKALDEMK